jgi:hypothetical protein
MWLCSQTMLKAYHKNLYDVKKAIPFTAVGTSAVLSAPFCIARPLQLVCTMQNMLRESFDIIDQMDDMLYEIRTHFDPRFVINSTHTLISESTVTPSC